MRAMGVGILAALGLALGAAAPAAAAHEPVPPGPAATRPGAAPAQVTAATVRQSERRFVVALSLSQPFAPATLRSSGRTLCLLVEPASGGGVSGQLCVIAPRAAGRPPRIVYQPVVGGVAGHATVVAATVHHRGRTLTATLLPAAFHDSYRSIRWQVRTTLTRPACLPRGGDNPLGCVSLWPATPRLARLHTPVLTGCTPRGPDLVFHGPTNGREVALTFDDGPFPDTPAFLAILERYRVPATFFEIGDQIATYGEGGAIERRMLADGDMIGDHTWSHPMNLGDGAFARDELEEAAGAIRAATGGFTPCLFRIPYGAPDPGLNALARSLGFTTIQWDVDPRDWATPGVGAIVGNVLANVHPGAIIIQHDGGGYRFQTLAALPQEITGLKRRGYRFVTVTQMLGDRLIYR